VLIKADCEGANFKLADLRGADLTEATLVTANFEGAKVCGAILVRAKLGDNPEGQVDASPVGDGTKIVSVREWLADLCPTEAGLRIHRLSPHPCVFRSSHCHEH
jgi:hypothetical protein